MTGIRQRVAAVVLSALLPLAAVAAGQATFDADSDRVVLFWDDSGKLRIDLPDEDEGYMIARDGKMYMVMEDDGETMVMEVGGMIAMAADFMDGGDVSLLDVSLSGLKPTGARETHAGIEGRVYTGTITESKGKQRAVELVLADHPLANELTDTYLRLLETLFGAERARTVSAALPAKERGVLRVDDEMRLASISGNTPAAELFELPAAPSSLADMFKGLAEQMQQLQQLQQMR
ncbi:MAG: hypothetical protein WCY98_10245 [Castellaniella sp.]